MRKYVVLMAVIAIVALPTFAMAGWNCSSMSSCNHCKPLCAGMSSCSTPCNTSVSVISTKSVTCPLVCPMKVTAAGMVPCSAAEAVPTDVSMITTLVPVSLQTVNGSNVVCATGMSQSMADKVVLLPMSCNNQQVLAPAQCKPVGADRMIFVPLDRQATCQVGPASLAVYMNGNMAMVPIDCPASLSSNAMCMTSTNGQTQILCSNPNW